MIELIAIKTGPRQWTITSSDMRDKYVCELPEVPVPEILKQEQAVRNWMEDVGLLGTWIYKKEQEPISE